MVARRAKVKPATVNRELFCLRKILEKAIDWGRLQISPARAVKPLPEVPDKARPLTDDEVLRLLEALPDHLRALAATVAYAGLRSAEVFHLRWSDVDLQAGSIRVVSRSDHPTKNRKSRIVAMPPDLPRLPAAASPAGSALSWCSRTLWAAEEEDGGPALRQHQQAAGRRRGCRRHPRGPRPPAATAQDLLHPGPAGRDRPRHRPGLDGSPGSHHHTGLHPGSARASAVECEQDDLPAIAGRGERVGVKILGHYWPPTDWVTQLTLQGYPLVNLAAIAC